MERLGPVVATAAAPAAREAEKARERREERREELLGIRPEGKDESEKHQ